MPERLTTISCGSLPRKEGASLASVLSEQTGKSVCFDPVTNDITIQWPDGTKLLKCLTPSENFDCIIEASAFAISNKDVNGTPQSSVILERPGHAIELCHTAATLHMDDHGCWLDLYDTDDPTKEVFTTVINKHARLCAGVESEDGSWRFCSAISYTGSRWQRQLVNPRLKEMSGDDDDEESTSAECCESEKSDTT